MGIHGWRTNKYTCIKNFMLSKNHIYEKIASKFCKHVLGVSKQTPDILANDELERYPVIGTILKQTYCYWQHILKSD